MNFKKRVNGSWTDTSHYIHNTSTDTITTLPAVLYPNGTTATVGLKGNTVQSTTPTSQNPVMPNGTGERTGNLFDGTLLGGLFTNADFNTSGDESVYKSIKVYLTAGTYTFSWGKNINSVRLIVDGNYSQHAYTNISTQTITSTTDGYVGISFRDTTSSSTIWDVTTPIMLNTGSTALPYEPYGYKLEIDSGGTTTPVYLGEVETTRRVKKLVLDGTGYWSAGIENFYKFIDTFGEGIQYSSVICTHSQHSTINNTGKALFMKISDFSPISSVADFKSYLAQQYAAGTPVCVWYVLATEETGIVNEPLMKIGDYADTLSNISIPVTAGGDTLSVGTTVQPSEVTANYKGWHPVSDVHERDNGAWT